MGRASKRNPLRELGVSDADWALAIQHQERQRQAGVPVLPVAVICGKQAPPKPADLTAHAFRRRGTAGQVALLLDQKALSQACDEDAATLRQAARIMDRPAEPTQFVFNFFRGKNMNLGFEYLDTIDRRLRDAAPTRANHNEALAVLLRIARHLRWESPECSKSATGLCELTGVKQQQMARTLNLLESVGAIQRVKRGRTKLILITPEGAFRGNVVTGHAPTVAKYLKLVENGTPAA